MPVSAEAVVAPLPRYSLHSFRLQASSHRLRLILWDRFHILPLYPFGYVPKLGYCFTVLRHVFVTFCRRSAWGTKGAQLQATSFKLQGKSKAGSRPGLRLVYPGLSGPAFGGSRLKRRSYILCLCRSGGSTAILICCHFAVEPPLLQINRAFPLFRFGPTASLRFAVTLPVLLSL